MSACEWKPLQGYPQTHCGRCKSGWTRGNAEGLAIVFCLLKRQQVQDDMTNCEKFELDHKLAGAV